MKLSQVVAVIALVLATLSYWGAVPLAVSVIVLAVAVLMIGSGK